MQCNQLHLCRNSLCGFALFCSIFHFYVFELHLLVPLIPINYLYVPKPFEIFGELFADFFAVGASVEFSGNESMKEETLTAPTKSRHPLALHGTCCPPHTPFRNSVTLEDTVHGSSNDVNVVVQWYFIDDLSEFIVRWGLSEPEKVARGLWLWPGLWSFLGVPRISLLLHVDLYCVCWQFGKHDQDTGSEVCHWESSLRRSWVNGGVNAYDEACCLGFESRCIKPRLD